MALMHRAHRVRKHRRIAHSGVENPERGGPGLNMRQLLRHPLGNAPFLIRCVDESEIFQSVIEKSEGLGGHITDVLASRAARQSSDGRSHGDVTT